MKEKTQLVFDRLEAQRGRIIKQYSRLTPEQLQHKPAPGEWNLLQVLRHLVTAERQSLAYIKRKVESKNKVGKAGPGASFRHAILKLALFLPLKFKAPRIAQVKENAPDFEEMKTEWAQVRDEIRRLIETCDEKTLSMALYKHPRAGYLNIKQALEFFEVHIKHHQKQMNRIMDLESYPQN